MWRLSNCLLRGARSVRPSQCCAQDNADETQKTRSGSPPPPIQCQDIVSHHATVTDPVKQIGKFPCPFEILSKCVHQKIRKWSNSHVNGSVRRPQFAWVWAIHCDVYPHAQAEWKNKYEKEKWRRYYRRRQQLLLTNSILNAVGWGSAAALTWTLCQYLRSYSFIYKQKSNQLYSINSTSESKTKYNQNNFICSANEEDNACENYQDKSQEWSVKGCFQQDDFNIQIRKEWLLSRDGLSSGRQYYAANSQNGSQNTSQDLRMFNPLVNFMLTDSVVTAITQQFVTVQDQSSNRIKDVSSPALLDDVPDSLDFYGETKPQIEFDQEILERHKVKEKDDSGFLEANSCENHSYTAGTQGDCSACSHATADRLVEASSNQAQECRTYESLTEESTKDKLIPEDILVTTTHQFPSERLSAKPEQSERNLHLEAAEINLHPKEKVLIEDCSISDSFQSSISSSSQFSEELEAKTSSLWSNTNAFGIDEFSDGLKEIIDAGQKDLNDFSSQYLGILEGNIGRSIATEDPKEALPYFRSGALLGDAASSFNLALCYHMAHGVEQDLKLARELYEAASLVGHGWATYNLAVLLTEGQGGPADPARACTLLAKAAKLGVTEAQMALKQMEKLEDDSATSSGGSSGGRAVPDKGNRRSSISSVQSEPSLTSVLSELWTSSYSTSDLDFMEDSMDQNAGHLSTFNLEVAEKPRFYLD